MSKAVKQLQQDVKQLKDDFKRELMDENFNHWDNRIITHEPKIPKLAARISDIESSIKEINDKLWKFENPFKFNVGDLVKINLREELRDIVNVYTLDIIDDKNIYKVISREFLGNNNKNYEIFDCKNNIKRSVREKDLILFTSEK
jgi:hypothetical protein